LATDAFSLLKNLIRIGKQSKAAVGVGATMAARSRYVITAEFVDEGPLAVYELTGQCLAARQVRTAA